MGNTREENLARKKCRGGNLVQREFSDGKKFGGGNLARENLAESSSGEIGQ